MSPALATELRQALGLRRAVETGTYTGAGARALARVFAEVVTIELSPELHHAAAGALASSPNVVAIQGSSPERLGPLAAEGVPSLYFLDGHWSGGPTAGADEECPVLAEIAAIGAGHPDDCLVIDDARLFAAAPPPPHDAAHWPTLIELFDAVRAQRPTHHVTVLADQVLAVPRRAKPVLDRFGQREATLAAGELGAAARGLARSLRSRLAPARERLVRLRS